MEELKNNKDVKELVPFATGDNYKGSLIVGTEKAFLGSKDLKEGKYFNKRVMEHYYEAVMCKKFLDYIEEFYLQLFHAQR